MNKFLVLFHLTRAEQTDAQWAAFISALNKGGHLIGGSALAKPSAIKLRENTIPKSKTVGGYMVLTDKNEAKVRSLVKLSPSHANGGLVEIFHLI